MPGERQQAQISEVLNPHGGLIMSLQLLSQLQTPADECFVIFLQRIDEGRVVLSLSCAWMFALIEVLCSSLLHPHLLDSKMSLPLVTFCSWRYKTQVWLDGSIRRMC